MVHQNSPIGKTRKEEAMAESDLLRNEEEPEESVAGQVLHWARCHPGVLVFGSLAVAALLAGGSQGKPQTARPREPETEAELVDGETPLFI
jgi:hypothetical protein